ncbi:hypothetical protein LPJ61_003080 [Coemansia biformis]|uniref:AMP-dependent synthetase/ligase domain-containing protein n=1 Tax=Coemansia biformis TaxID=1286918 RepID=A0A9W8CWL4_9FUNG|nr:hypothetical protein LPJ61_003080 [Coemansia biformis]
MIVVSPLQQSPLPVGDIPSYVFGAAEQHMDDVALVDAGTRQQLTASDIYVTATRLAAGLTRCGYGGRAISALVDTELRCVYVYYAALMAGGTCQSLCPDMPAAGLRSCIERSCTPVVFTTSSRVEQLRAACCGLDVAVYVLDDACGGDGCSSGCLSFMHLLVDDPAFVPVRITTRSEAIAKPAFLAYTPGPRDVLRPLTLTHYGLLSWCRIARRPAPEAQRRVAVSAMPLSGSCGIANIAQFPILSGSCVVQMRAFSPVACLTALEEWRADSLLATHDVLTAIAADASRGASGRVFAGGCSFDLSALQAVYTHVLRGPNSFKDKVTSLLGARLVELYGYAETGIIAGVITEYPRVDGSVGLLCPGVSARVVLDGKDVDEGRFGEILVTTPRLASVTGDAEYFPTGDYGTVTREGIVVVKSRMCDVLRLGDGSVVASQRN